jgi:hypothetical protein
MNTEAHFWTVSLDGDPAAEYGPFDTLEAAGEFARDHWPFGQVHEFRGYLVKSQEVTREEYEALKASGKLPGLLCGPDEVG